MRKSWLLCVALGTLAWSQAAPGTPPPAQPRQAQGSPMERPEAPPPPADTSASVPANAPVLTIEGVCAPQPKAAPAAKGTTARPAAKTPATDCKTIITKADFEKLGKALAPNLTAQQKKQLASVLPRFIAMSSQARKQGLDKTPAYEETLKFAKMQILSNELQRSLQEQAAKISPEDIANYYKEHSETFQQYNLDRLFVPRTKQESDAKEEDKDKGEKLTEEQQKAKEAAEKAKSDAAEQEMTQLAETLRARAAAGEDFVKLQKEAFQAAGMKIESPTVTLNKVRRSGLPPAHASVFDLKPGAVSQVINDAGGHYIYKVESEDVPPLDQVKEEIHNTLQNQRMRDSMDKVNSSFKVDQNEAYFGPPGPAGPGRGMMPPPRMPNPRMAPSPTAPAPKPN